MGTALGRALQRRGHNIQLVVTKHASSARKAASFISERTIPLTERELVKAPETLANSDVLLICTPDDALEVVAKQLANAIAATHRSSGPRFALHTSGAVSSEVLAPLKAAGLKVASLHPLVSVPHANADPNSFSAVHFCIEGQPAAIRLARMLVRDLNGHSFTIASEAKPLYHAAAAISSGHVVALFDLAIEMLVKCGLSKRTAQKILAPLLISTAATLVSNTPAKALTGPFARGDIGTTRKHLRAMKANHLNEATVLYSALGLRAVGLAMTTKRDRTALKNIAKLLSR